MLIFGPSADLAGGDSLLRELVARGRSAEQSRSLTGIATAKSYYRRAIELDPDFAPAYAALSRAHALTALIGYSAARPALDSARLMAAGAVARDGDLPEAHAALAMSLGDAGDYDGAEREFQRAIQLDARNPEAHYWYGILLVGLGRATDARREVTLALELDPLSPPRGVMMIKRATTYLETGTRPPAQWDSVNALEPGEPWAHRAHALDLAHRGRCGEARTEIESAERLAPDVIQMMFAIALIERLCGNADGARAMIERMKAHPRASDDGIWIAMTHAPFGELDSAFAWLDRQVWTTAELTDLRANRWLDSLRADPRYERLLRQLGLRASPLSSGTAGRDQNR
jgi:Flp pilus assembly protein TadD